MQLRDINIDWQRLVLNLRRLQSIQKTADELDIDADTLRRIARGDTTEPKFDAGIKLLNAHLDRCPNQHQQLIR